VPAAWRRILHGWWPDGLLEDLTALGTAITTGGAAAFDGDYGHYSGVTALAPSTPTTTRCGSVASTPCTSYRRAWTRSCRCAGSAQTIPAPAPTMFRCGLL
jgi:hypothetical protein